MPWWAMICRFMILLKTGGARFSAFHILWRWCWCAKDGLRDALDEPRGQAAWWFAKYSHMPHIMLLFACAAAGLELTGREFLMIAGDFRLRSAISSWSRQLRLILLCDRFCWDFLIYKDFAASRQEWEAYESILDDFFITDYLALNSLTIVLAISRSAWPRHKMSVLLFYLRRRRPYSEILRYFSPLPLPISAHDSDYYCDGAIFASRYSDSRLALLRFR